VTFALEDCRHLTRRLERDLFSAGRRVVRVPTRGWDATRLMAGARPGGRKPGKSDPIDAEAVALAAFLDVNIRTAMSRTDYPQHDWTALPCRPTEQRRWPEAGWVHASLAAAGDRWPADR